jgi:diadenosine tetraphosphate (Ap4A) HIT family hydrolase
MRQSVRVTSPDRRVPFDLQSYVKRVQSGDCFVCGIVAGEPALPAHIVFRDGAHIAFMSNFPVLRGYVLLAPIEHRERVVEDFTIDEYLALQATAYRLGRAVSAVVPTERLYVLSLGSKDGNSHVHWHIAPLPPGVPYEEQQFAALMAEHIGYLDIADSEQADLARRIAAAMTDSA